MAYPECGNVPGDELALVFLDKVIDIIGADVQIICFAKFNCTHEKTNSAIAHIHHLIWILEIGLNLNDEVVETDMNPSCHAYPLAPHSATNYRPGVAVLAYVRPWP